MLRDNGIAFADPPPYRNGPTAEYRGHAFDRVCWIHGVTHKLDTHEALAGHVTASVSAYNYAKHRKALRWRTPFQAVCDAWARDPAPFKIDPHHLTPGPYT